jgi:hypothetical protein
MMAWHDLEGGFPEVLFQGRRLSEWERFFWVRYLSYWRGLKIDSLKAWTAEEMAYFNSHVEWDKNVPV